MNDSSHQQESIELLQQLGLKEYEAKTFVALARQPSGTAKDISETSDVPRTRVYDATRVLESKGLVETQHSSPQEFRAVSIDEAITTLQTEYEERTVALRQALSRLEPIDNRSSDEVTHEVWSLSDSQGITSRTLNLVDDADEECLLILGHEDVFTERLATHLQRADQRGVSVNLGAFSESLQTTVRERLPNSTVFVPELEWLKPSQLPDDETEISRLLLTDREKVLLSSFTAPAGDMSQHEQAVFGRGFDNGLVAIVRRLIATGLLFEGSPALSEL